MMGSMRWCRSFRIHFWAGLPHVYNTSSCKAFRSRHCPRFSSLLVTFPLSISLIYQVLDTYHPRRSQLACPRYQGLRGLGSPSPPQLLPQIERANNGLLRRCAPFSHLLPSLRFGEPTSIWRTWWPKSGHLVSIFSTYSSLTNSSLTSHNFSGSSVARKNSDHRSDPR